MLVVILVIVTSATSRSTNAQTILAPCRTSGQISFVGEDTVDLSGHLRCVAGGETSNDDIIVDIVTHNLAVLVVAFT